MMKILDAICNLAWYAFIGINRLIYYLFISINFFLKLIWTGLCKLGALGRGLKKIEFGFKFIWQYSFLIFINLLSNLYKRFIEFGCRNKILKRIFTILLILFLAYIIYPPSHWGPWQLYKKGTASWYGPGFYWKTKANGKTYYPWEFSAASKTIKLGSMAKVVNLDNGKTVYVKVDDRGPYVKNRVLDLSYMAAVKLGMKNKGIAKVAIYLKNNN